MTKAVTAPSMSTNTSPNAPVRSGRNVCPPSSKTAKINVMHNADMNQCLRSSSFDDERKALAAKKAKIPYSVK